MRILKISISLTANLSPSAILHTVLLSASFKYNFSVSGLVPGKAGKFASYEVWKEGVHAVEYFAKVFLTWV